MASKPQIIAASGGNDRLPPDRVAPLAHATPAGAGVVARRFGNVCVVGSITLQIDQSGRRYPFGSHPFDEETAPTIDGSTAAIHRGETMLHRPRPSDLPEQIRAWGRVA
jgi:hypothetical protein